MSLPDYEPYVRATALSGLEDLLQKYGIDLPELFDEVGISRKALKDASMLISIVAYYRLLNLLEERTSLDNFGFELMISNQNLLNNVGPLALILKLGDTTGKCVENGLQFVRYHTNGVQLALSRDEQTRLAEFRYTTLPPLFKVRHLVEHALGIACAAMRFLASDDNYNPRKVSFQHRKPKNPDPLEKYFNCPVEFNAATNSLYFETDLLDRPTSGSVAQLANIVFSYLTAEIEKVESKHSLPTSVAALIGQLLPSGRCTIELIAKGLALHLKTLQRRLKAQGTSYTDILIGLIGIRRATALRLLSETKLPSSKIAILCGYSSAGAFNLAFKEWYQVTPGQFRSSRS